MPTLPEDIIDRLVMMERRIQQLSTAVNTRPALDSVPSGSLQITGSGTLGISGGGALRITSNGTLHISDGGALRVYDAHGDEFLSDDSGTGGLARPWLTMLPPQDTDVSRWPQTLSGSWTTIATSLNPVWQPKLRLYMPTAVASGCAGSVQVLLNGAPWGDAVTAGTTLDRTDYVASDFTSVFGTVLRVEVQAQVTSGAGPVYACPQMMYGRQT